MNRAQRSGLFIVLIIAAVGSVAYYLGARHASTATSFGTTKVQVSDPLNTELEQIRSAEKIEDPYRRCMAYPNPAEFHWSPQAIEAMCRRLSRRMIGWAEIDDALKQQHPEHLDQVFDGYLAKNYSEADQHGYLTWTFWWMFQSSSSWAEQATQRWVESDPQSAYALAARGIHYTQAAYDARGDKRAAATPDANFKRMSEFVEKARNDLEASLKLNPRLIAAYHGLLRTSRLSSDDDEEHKRDEWIKQALALDPDDPWIYQDWMDAVDPNWGGSQEQMDRVASLATQRAQSNPLLGLLKANPLCNEADHYRCESCDKDGRKSLNLYRKAGEIGPALCFLDGAGAAAVLAQDLQTAVRYYSQAYRFLGGDEWLAYRAQNLRSVGRGDWALENLNVALARNPENTTLLYALALAYADAGRSGDIEKTYLYMLKLDPKNQTAALELGKFYITDMKLPEKARPLIDQVLEHDSTLALAWFEKAMLCEATDDKPGYRAAAARFLHYANHSDPWQATNIALVESKLKIIGAATPD